MRYALLACIVEAMVAAFNRKIGLGLRRGQGDYTYAMGVAHRADPRKPFEEPPEWAQSVPPVEEWVNFEKDGEINYNRLHFSKRRICADASKLWNIQ